MGNGAPADRTDRLLAGHAGRMLVVLTVAFAVVKTARYALPPLLPAISADLSLTPFQAGLGLATINVFFAAQQFPSGRLSDQLSRKTVLFASLAFMTLGCLTLAATPTYAVFLLGMVLVGIGGGLFPSASRAWVTDLFTARRGEAFGFHLASVDVAGIVASGLAFVVFSTFVSWRFVFLPIVALLVILLPLVQFWSTERVVLARVDLNVRETAVRVLATRRVRRVALVVSLYMFTVQGLTGFLPTYLQVEGGFDPSTASLAFAALFVTGAISKPLTGRFSDGNNRLIVGAAGLAVGAAGVGLFLAVPSGVPAVVGVVLFAAGHKGFLPTVEAYLMDGFEADSMGGDLGILRTVYWSAGSLGPAYVGYVSAVLGYREAFLGFVGTLVAGAVVASWLAVHDD
ncbi:MAG: MFS transporter [Halorhabdus sp.]